MCRVLSGTGHRIRAVVLSCVVHLARLSHTAAEVSGHILALMRGSVSGLHLSNGCTDDDDDTISRYCGATRSRRH